MAAAARCLGIGDDERPRGRSGRRPFVGDVEGRADGVVQLEGRDPEPGSQLPRVSGPGRRQAQRMKMKKNTIASAMRYQPKALKSRFFTNARNDLMAMIAVTKLTTKPMARPAKFPDRAS